MKVKEWIASLQQQNPEAEVRYDIYWKADLTLRDDMITDPDPAFPRDFSDLLDINIFYHDDDDEDE